MRVLRLFLATYMHSAWIFLFFCRQDIPVFMWAGYSWGTNEATCAQCLDTPGGEKEETERAVY